MFLQKLNVSHLFVNYFLLLLYPAALPTAGRHRKGEGGEI